MYKRCSLMLPYSFREQLHELKRCCWFYRWSVCIHVCVQLLYGTVRTFTEQRFLNNTWWSNLALCDHWRTVLCIHFVIWVGMVVVCMSLCVTLPSTNLKVINILSQYLACWELHYNLRVVPKLFILSVWNRLYFFPCTKRI